MELADILKGMNNKASPSGFEAAAVQAAAEIIEPFCDEVKTDRLGNIIGFKRCGAQDARTIMLDAHIDRVGFIVTNVYDDGFLKVKSIGGIDPRVLPSAEVKILTEPPVYGVFTSIPPHLAEASDEHKAVSLDNLYIDTGIRVGASDMIKAGTPVVFAEGICELNGKVVSGSGLDNSLGFAIVARIMDKLKDSALKVNIAICGAAAEETGGAGAKTAAYSINPDCAIAVDTSHAQTHDCAGDETFEFGGGPLIGLGPNLDRDISKKMIDIAKRKNIKYQLEVMEGSTGTDAWQIQTVRIGIPCGLVSIPIKYMHTPVEAADLNDAEAAAEIIAEYISCMK